MNPESPFGDASTAAWHCYRTRNGRAGARRCAAGAPVVNVPVTEDGDRRSDDGVRRSKVIFKVRVVVVVAIS